jgi:hypothetical protein
MRFLTEEVQHTESESKARQLKHINVFVHNDEQSMP